jgi:protein TonB
MHTPAPPAAAARPPAPPTLVGARFDADYLDNPAPAYPPLSRRMKEEGRVMLRVLVTAGGLPGRIEISAGSGSNRLDRAAADAVRRWRFVPAREGDDAVEAWVIVPIVFKLEGS